VPRGRALGVAFTLPEDDRVSVTRQQLEASLVMAYGGRAAEELVFGRDRVTTGAASDIQQATRIARGYVTQWGLSDSVGPVAIYNAGGGELFLGRDIQQRREISEKTAELVDSEVARIVNESLERARQTLRDNIDGLHAVASALLERETLTREEVEALLEGETLAPLPVAADLPPSTPAEVPAAAPDRASKPQPGVEGLTPRLA
jgi:cell division protease FtsH